MYMCLCNPFSDKKVEEHLTKTDGRTTVSEVYKACSGGSKPNCCSCLETLKDMVKIHNSSRTDANNNGKIPAQNLPAI